MVKYGPARGFAQFFSDFPAVTAKSVIKRMIK
jgi:hypothetical protein